ncbi:MAG: T9SS type A sorting domain-containing protein [Crocinitomicaceae bacterium]
MKYFFLIVHVCLASFGSAQFVSEITILDPVLSESSGLLWLNNKVITHNDSGNEPALYELDTLSGLITRKITVGNASNQDWEDLTADANFIYIGDFGNNEGNRTDLRIYRVSQNEYWNTLNDTVYADTIRFNYADQLDFSIQAYATNFDCEALSVIGDSLYLFTKNWLNQKTNMYVLPKLPGDYSALKRDSLPVQGLITSADFNFFSNRLALCGYGNSPFILEVEWEPNVAISAMDRVRYDIVVPNSIQIEAIVSITANDYYLTSESAFGNTANLMRLKGVNGGLGIESIKSRKIDIFPNPVSNEIVFLVGQGCEKQLFSISGQLVKTSKEDKMLVSDLEKGIYWLKFTDENSQFVSISKISVN